MSKKRRHRFATVLLSSVWVYSECGRKWSKAKSCFSQTTVRQKTLFPVAPGPSRFPKRLPCWVTKASQPTGTSLIHPCWWMTQGQQDNTNHGNNSRSPLANSIFAGIRQTSSFSKRREKKKRRKKILQPLPKINMDYIYYAYPKKCSSALGDVGKDMTYNAVSQSKGWT